MYYTFVLTGLSRLYQNADNTSSLEPPKFCITIVSNFSRLVAAASREIEGNANALFFLGGGGRRRAGGLIRCIMRNVEMVN